MPYRKPSGWGFIKPPVGTPIDYSQPITQGLVARCLYNQHGGYYFPDSTGRWVSFELIGARPPGRFGAPCLSFDGTTYAALTRAGVAAAPVITALPFTVVTWVCLTSAADGVVAFSMSDEATTNAFYLLSIVGSTSVFRVLNGDAGGTSSAATSATATVGRWYQLVGVWTSNTDRRVYVNGLLGAADTNTRATDNSLLDNTLIGALKRTTTIFATGKVDNVSIFNRALTAAEILWLFNRPFGDFAQPRRRITTPGAAAAGSGSNGRMFLTF